MQRTALYQIGLWQGERENLKPDDAATLGQGCIYTKAVAIAAALSRAYPTMVFTLWKSVALYQVDAEQPVPIKVEEFEDPC